MKDQYTGDVGDYGKYGLLRHLSENGIKVFVNWYLTEDDGSTDGKHITYLDQKKKFRKFDPELFDRLEKLVRSGCRSIESFEKEDSIKGASYYHARLTPDTDRDRWHREALLKANGCGLSFLDPDNGLIEKKVPAKESVKHCLAREAADYYRAGSDVVYYCQRDRSPKEIWNNKLMTMKKYLLDAKIMILTCHRGTQRAYVFVLHEENEERYRALFDSFLLCWQGFFTAEEL